MKETNEMNDILCNGCYEILQEGYNFCPYCGRPRQGRFGIFEKISLGSKIRVTFDGGDLVGRLKRISNDSVAIKTFDDRWVSVKYDAITSVENFGKMINIQDLPKIADKQPQTLDNESKIKFLYADDLLSIIERIYEKEGIEYSKHIETDSVVTNFYGSTFVVQTDKGEKITCMKNKTIKLDKSLYKTGEIVGCRIFCGPISLDGICRCAIQEMTYKRLLEKLKSSLKRNEPSAKRSVETIIPYFKYALRNTEAIKELEELESKAKMFF
jgi:hypothetical protein